MTKGWHRSCPVTGKIGGKPVEAIFLKIIFQVGIELSIKGDQMMKAT